MVLWIKLSCVDLSLVSFWCHWLWTFTDTLSFHCSSDVCM